ncbi:MAG: hypothetical protein AAB262_03005 [Elusimicrobiota bacterium]
MTTNVAVGTPLCVKCHKATVYVGGAAGSRFGDHGQGNHHVLNTGTGAGGYGGCLMCHGNFNGADFHGENYQWAATANTAAGPAYRFINNVTNMTGWSPGKCWQNNAGGCNTKHNKTY